MVGSPPLRPCFKGDVDQSRRLSVLLHKSMEYRIHFLTHGHRAFRVDHFDAEHDEAAKAHASRHYRSGIGKGYEIWEGDRHVHTEVYR